MSNKYWLPAWETQVAEQSKKTGVDQAEWKAAGRATKANPDKENGVWWQENGEGMVDNWIKWREGNNGWEIFTLHGKPAIELGITPIWNDVPVQMHIDRVMVNPDGELVVLDIKTGSRTPTSDLQLAFYAAGMESVLGIRPKWGTYWMAREGTTSGLIDLDLFPTEWVIDIVTKFDNARKSGIFLPNFSHCMMCNFKSECKYKEGK